jgi:hypothetical protein
MGDEIESNGRETRLIRFCTSYHKDTNGHGSFGTTGMLESREFEHMDPHLRNVLRKVESKTIISFNRVSWANDRHYYVWDEEFDF